MPPHGFTDEEISSISALASALPAFARGRFLQQLASQLSAYPPEARGPASCIASVSRFSANS